MLYLGAQHEEKFKLCSLVYEIDCMYFLRNLSHENIKNVHVKIWYCCAVVRSGITTL